MEKNINDRLVDDKDLFSLESNAANAALYTAQLELRRLQTDFIQTARWAAEKLETAAIRVEATGETNNSLGILQGMAPEVDRLAGQIATQASAVRLLLAVREDGQDGDE